VPRETSGFAAGLKIGANDVRGDWNASVDSGAIGGSAATIEVYAMMHLSGLTSSAFC
jgi:hypothetical protein